MGHPDDIGPLARVVYEALGRMASDDAAEGMVAEALAACERPVLDEDPSSLASFITGALFDVVSRQLGEDEANAMLVDLAPIVERASSQLSPPPGARQRPPPAQPVLLLATGDSDRVKRLSYAAPEFIVRGLDDVFGLVQGVERYGHGRLTLIVDCTLPTVHPGTLATLNKLIPADTRVILWGAERLPPVPGTTEWQRLSASANEERVASAARGRVSGVMTFSVGEPEPES